MLKSKGHRLHQVVLTNGELGQDFRHFDPDIISTRRQEHEQAAKYLGFDSIHYLEEPDLQLTYTPRVMFGLLKIIRDIKPTIVIVMHPADPHPDHRAAYQLGLEAVRWAGSGVRPDLGTSHHVATLLLLPGLQSVAPHLVVDISSLWQQKLQLLQIHASQASPELIARLTTLSQLYAGSLPPAKGGATHAEAFSLDPSHPSTWGVEGAST